MKIACLSDIHGFLPEIPDCDLLLLGGDYCPYTKYQNWWFRDSFKPWIHQLSKRMKIIGVAGNHDFIFEKYPDLLPQLDWTYLQDSGCEFNGLKFWGSPWQLRFFDWAFNADEHELDQKWGLIPEGTDVLVLHGPPKDHGDFSMYGNERIGSISLLNKIEEIQPKLVIYGHNHSGYGQYKIGNTLCVNCSYVNDEYKPANKIQIVEI